MPSARSTLKSDKNLIIITRNVLFRVKVTDPVSLLTAVTATAERTTATTYLGKWR